jgi:hypothetical protein
MNFCKNLSFGYEQISLRWTLFNKWETTEYVFPKYLLSQKVLRDQKVWEPPV